MKNTIRQIAAVIATAILMVGMEAFAQGVWGSDNSPYEHAFPGEVIIRFQVLPRPGGATNQNTYQALPGSMEIFCGCSRQYRGETPWCHTCQAQEFAAIFSEPGWVMHIVDYGPGVLADTIMINYMVWFPGSNSNTYPAVKVTAQAIGGKYGNIGPVTNIVYIPENVNSVGFSPYLRTAQYSNDPNVELNVKWWTGPIVGPMPYPPPPVPWPKPRLGGLMLAPGDGGEDSPGLAIVTLTGVTNGDNYVLSRSTNLLSGWTDLATNSGGYSNIMSMVVNLPDDSKVNLFKARHLSSGTMSSNIVGAIAQTIESGYQSIANPLDNGDNSISNLFVMDSIFSAAPGSVFMPWTGSSFGANECDLWDWTWQDPTYQFPPGKGALFNNPGDPWVHFWYGEVVSSYSNSIPTGYSMLGATVPVSGYAQTDIGFTNAVGGDVISLFDGSTQIPCPKDLYDETWSLQSGTPFTCDPDKGPVIPLGAGFLYQNNSGSAFPWVIKFNP